MSHNRQNNAQGYGCLGIIIALVLIFFGPTIMEIVLFILFVIIGSILHACSSLTHAIIVFL